jgi:hypothetical protein
MYRRFEERLMALEKRLDTLDNEDAASDQGCRRLRQAEDFGYGELGKIELFEKIQETLGPHRKIKPNILLELKR